MKDVSRAGAASRRGPSVRWLLAALIAVTLPAGPTRGGEPSRLGCLAKAGPEVLEQSRADELFVPASVHKLAVAAAAMHHLGPRFQVHTRIWAPGTGEAGAREVTELVVEAAADPTWSRRYFDGGDAEPLAELARQVVASGVRKVSGDLVIDLSAFPGRPVPSSRAFGDLAFGFAAPTSALAIENNAVPLRMAPGAAVGRPAIFESEELEIINLTTTAPAARHEKGTVDFQAQWHDGRLVVRGEYPISEPPYRIEIGVADGARRAGQALRVRLESAGVDIAGDVRLRLSQVGTGSRTSEGMKLAELTSLPLVDWLPAILEDSSNWHAEMLLRVLARELTGEGRPDEGLAALRELLEKEAGLPPQVFALDDASGISPFNLWTPRAVIGLLEWIWRQPWRVSFVGALSTPGRGTLTAWPRMPTELAAKTGSARHTDALAGYLPRLDAAPVVFVCLSNQGVDARAAVRQRIAAKVRSWRNPPKKR